MWLCLLLSPFACELLQALEERSPKALSSLDIRPTMSAGALAPHPVDLLRQLLKESVSSELRQLLQNRTCDA